jgi:Capsular polysaccharide synthesis, CpsB/CapC
VKRAHGPFARDVIDLHCHILSGIDDGALDLADSVAMGRQADRDGVALVCATPHIRHDHRVRIADLVDRVAELNAALEDAGASARVLPGGEVAETIVEHLDDAELRAVTLGGGGRWILLEPRPGPLSGRQEPPLAAAAIGDVTAGRPLRGHEPALAGHPRQQGPDHRARFAAGEAAQDGPGVEPAGHSA